MKSIKKMALLFAVAFSTMAFANNPTDVTSENAKLGAEIQKLFKDSQIKVEKETLAEVTFTLNKNQEIVVLSIENDNKVVESFIKAKLNYKKLSKAYLGKDKTFIVPIKLVPQS